MWAWTLRYNFLQSSGSLCSPHIRFLCLPHQDWLNKLGRQVTSLRLGACPSFKIRKLASRKGERCLLFTNVGNHRVTIDMIISSHITHSNDGIALIL